MRIVKVGVLAPTNKGIPLGVQGESCATEVEFDVRPWLREYPSGTVSAVAKREGDPAPYPLSLDVADGTAVWLVSDTDTAKAGVGAVELTMTSGGTRVRSLTFKTAVTTSLTDAPVDDDAWYGWLDKAVVKVDETVQAAQRKMADVDAEWTGLKADVTAKVEECGEVAAQAAKDAHHAKVDARATAKALESAEGSAAKAKSAAKRAEDAASDAAESASSAAKSASDSAASVDAINVIAPKTVKTAAVAARSNSLAIGEGSKCADASASQVAVGIVCEANGKVASALGIGSTADGDASVSLGSYAHSVGDFSTAVGTAASTDGLRATAIGAYSQAIGTSSLSLGIAYAIGTNSISEGYNAVANAVQSTVLGCGAGVVGDAAPDVNKKEFKASRLSSVALGSFSYTDEPDCVSVGNGSDGYDYYLRVYKGADMSLANTAPYWEKRTVKFPSYARKLKRRITNVAEPTDWHNAANKAYVDSNTTNALIGRVSGKLLHVEDAWPSPILSVTIDGAYRQDGTPSPESPVPISVVENPVLKVTGRNLVDLPDMTVPITLPAEHPYLAALPDGTHDTIEIDKYGNASLIARVQKADVSNLPTPSASDTLDNGLTRYQYWSVIDPPARNDSTAVTPAFNNVIDFAFPQQGMYVSSTSIIVGASAEPTDTLKAGGYIYTTLATPVIYPLGKLDIPALPETISDVFVEASLTPEMSMTYKRDINLVLEVGQGLHNQNDEPDIDQANLPLASGGYAALANVTAKTTEHVGGIASGDDDVQTATVTAPVFEKDGALYAWGLSVARSVRTTYTAGMRVHVEMDFAVGQTRLNQSLLKLALVSFGDGFQHVPTTKHNVGDVVYLTVEVTTDKDVKAGSTMLVKFI